MPPVAAAVLLAGVGDHRPGPRLARPRHPSGSSATTCSGSAGRPRNRARAPRRRLEFAAPRRPRRRGLFSGTAPPEFVRFAWAATWPARSKTTGSIIPGRAGPISRAAWDACPFPENADRVLDFFACLVSRPVEPRAATPADRQETLRRPLLPSGCPAAARGIPPVAGRIVTGDWDAIDLDAPGRRPADQFRNDRH